MKFKIFLTFLFSGLAIGAMPNAFADSQFNQDLQQFLECKKTLKNYYDLGFDVEDDLKRMAGSNKVKNIAMSVKSPLRYSVNLQIKLA